MFKRSIPKNSLYDVIKVKRLQNQSGFIVIPAVAGDEDVQLKYNQKNAVAPYKDI